MTAQAVTAPVNAGDFSMCRHQAGKKHERSESEFHLRELHHHMAAQTTMMAPSGSGAANAPNSASAAGDRKRFLKDRGSKDFIARPSTLDRPD